MDMCYDGALVMPSSFAVMCEDEMTYVEGGGLGYSFYMKRSVAATIIDVAAIAITAGLSTSASVGKFAAKIGWKTLKKKVKKAMIKIGVSKTAATAAADILKTVCNFSIGSAAAWCLDKTDASGLNGYITYFPY